jgi:hypothetical protein
VVRQGTDSPLLEFITACRYAVTKSKAPFEPFAKYLPDKSNSALLVKRRSLLKYAFKKISGEFTQNPDCFRILSWTNAQVDYYNQQIRNHLYSKTASRFIPGERLITRDPVLAPVRAASPKEIGKTIILSTSTEFTIQEFSEDRYSNYPSWRLKVATDDGVSRQIYALHEGEQNRFDAETSRLLAIAKRNPFLWRDYYHHLGAALAGRLSNEQLERTILVLLVIVGIALIVESLLPQKIPALLPAALSWRVPAGVLFGLAIGLVSSHSIRDTDHDSSLTTIEGQDCKAKKADWATDF